MTVNLVTVASVMVAFGCLMAAALWLRSRRLYTMREAVLRQIQRSLQGSGFATWEWNITRGRCEFDPLFFKLLDVDAQAHAGQTLLQMLEPLVHPLDREYFLRQFNAPVESHDHHIQMEFRVVKAQWHCQWLELQAQVFHLGGDLLISGTMADITGRKHVSALPTTTDFVDPLTQLPNRGYLLAKAQYLVQPHNDALSAALCILHVDDYLSIKTAHGTAVADLALKVVSVRLKNLLRQNDVVVRLGGADFCIILPYVQHPQVQEVCQKLVAGLREPVNIQDEWQEFQFGLGVAMLPNDGEDYLTLMSKADAAALRAKSDPSGFYFYEAQSVHPPTQSGFSLTHRASA